MAKAIKAQMLTKFYGDLLAVDHISFAVEEGETLRLPGPQRGRLALARIRW